MKDKAKTISESPDKKTSAPTCDDDIDISLMSKIAAGDRDAFAELVRRNTPKIHAMLFRFLGDADRLEDLTQEVFLRIHRHAPRYKPTAKFSTWLYRIAVNLAMNAQRTGKKERSLQLRDGMDGQELSLADLIPDHRHEAPDERIAADELREKIAKAMKTLPETQRIAITLNKYEQKSYVEIAEIIDSTPEAVKSLLSRARASLHDALIIYLKEDYPTKNL